MNHCCHCLTGCEEITGGHDGPCERCARGNHRRVPVPRISWQSFSPLAKAHAFEAKAHKSLCGNVIHAKAGYAPAPNGPWCRRCEVLDASR